MTPFRIDNNYQITRKTSAITHSSREGFQSKILDEAGICYSIHPPKDILELNCIRHHSTLEGREIASKFILQTKSKLPISINPDLGLYFFPTASSRNVNCAWLSYYQINDYYSLDDHKVAIRFYNGTSLHTRVSTHVLEQQYSKTSTLIASFYRDLIS